MKRVFGILLALLTAVLVVMTVCAADDENGFTFAEENGCAVITGYLGEDSVVSIPEKIKGLTVSAIGKSAFEDKSFITEINIPDSVKSIGRYAFLNCEKLVSVNIPSSVEKVDSDAFSNTAIYNDGENWQGCALYISDCLLSVDVQYAGDFVIRDGTRLIAQFAFGTGNKLKSIEFPESVSVIAGDFIADETNAYLIKYYVHYGSAADAFFSNNGFDYEYVGAVPEGWKKQNESWYYYLDGAKKVGWYKIGADWYFFNADGTMKTGWLRGSGKWYYLSPDGKMKTGWLIYRDNWYYLSENGSMKTGWLSYKSKWYYLSSDGSMKTGWLKYKEKWYFLLSDGKMATGWAKTENEWYLFSEKGIMLTGWQKSGGSWYYLSSSGKMLTGSRKISGKWYYLSPDGRWNGNKKEKVVYVARTGKRYHYSSTCGNNDFSEITLSEAKEKGYTPCSRCVK